MKFKMRILSFSPAGNTERMAADIARSQQANADKIPPAYPCENEKLLFLGVEVKGSSVNKAVIDFCKDMSAARAKNVALFVVGGGNFDAVNELKQILTSKGVALAGEPYLCTVKGGLFKKAAVTDADVQGATVWAGKIVDQLADA